MNENYELGYENGQVAMLDVLNSIRDWQIERIEELHD